MFTSDVIKLSSPATKEFWEIPILFADEHLLALDKPGRLLTSPDRYDFKRPNLMKLLHREIERGAAVARKWGLTYLANVHRLDFETTGVLLLAKNKTALIALANQFSAERPANYYAALVHGNPVQSKFRADARLAPHPTRMGEMRVDQKNGKKAITEFSLVEKFTGYSLLRCRPLTPRTHQIRVHLRQTGLPIVGDALYGGEPLLLSRLKKQYRLKPNATERPLISRVALHAQELTLTHPVSGDAVTINAPWPKDLTVALRYLRRYAVALAVGQAHDEPPADDNGRREQDRAGDLRHSQ